MVSRSALAAVSLLMAFAVQPASAQVLAISSPGPALVVGQSMTLTPLLRDGNGNLLTANDWVWTALNPDILSVDAHGTVKGLKLGFGSVKLTAPAEANTQFGLLQIQIQPQNVTVSPVSRIVATGDSFQFSATAFDFNNQPLPNPGFTWFLTNEGGVPQLIPSTTTIDANGNFTSTDAGRYTVHASIIYQSIVQGLPSHFEGLASVSVVVPPAYRIDRLVSSDPVTTNQLLPSPGAFVGSQEGAVQFTASLGGFSTAIVNLDKGVVQAVVATGAPSPEPGTVIAGFQSVAMNANGDSLTAIKAGDTANGALLARTAQGTSRFVLLDNANGADRNGLSASLLTFMSLTPYCLNDNGTAVIRALYLPQDADPSAKRDGLFVLHNAMTASIIPLLVWSAEQSVPPVNAVGTPPRLQFVFDDTESVPGWASSKGLGIDNQENVYFVAQSFLGSVSQGRGLFQLPAGSTSPQKIVAVGDTFLKSTVKDIQDLIVMGSGDLVLLVNTNDNVEHVTLYRAGNLLPLPKYFADLPVFGIPRVLAASAAGVLFDGIPAQGKPEALYRWDYKTATDVLDISSGASYISTATINSGGVGIAAVQNPSNGFVLIQTGASPAAGKIVFSSGTVANLTAAVDLKSLVRGSRSALPSVQMSDPASLFDLDGSGHAVARVTPGQILAGNTLFSGANNVVEDGTGNQYFVSSGALLRRAGTSVTQLLPAGTKASDGVLLTPYSATAVSSQGVVVLDCQTNATDGHRRLYKLQNGALTLIARTKTNYGQRQLIGWNEVAIDDNGNVATILAEDLGYEELVEWTGTSGRSVNNTWQGFTLAGEKVAGYDRLRTSGTAFFVRFALTADYTHAAEVRFDASSLTTLVKSSDPLPDGTLLGDIRLTDVNRNGEVVFTSTEQRTGAQVLAYRNTGGTLRIVAVNDVQFQTADYVTRFTDVNIRDDGTVYFLAFDVNDRVLAFRALPVGPSTPNVTAGGIVNAADFSGDTLTPGAWFTIYGQNFGSAAQWKGDPNTFSLGGVSVTVCGTPALVSYTSGPLAGGPKPLWQVNALMPDSVAGQTSCPVAVTVNGQASPAIIVNIAPASLVLFGFYASASGALPLVTHADYSLVGAVADGLQPAAPGEILLGWGSGSCAAPSIVVGGKPSNVLFSGRVASGLCQTNFSVPDGVTGATTMTLSTSPHSYVLAIK